jgi:hypothetical protein
MPEGQQASCHHLHLQVQRQLLLLLRALVGC